MKVLFIEYKNFGTEDAADAFKNLGITPVIWSTPLVRERVSSEFDQTFEQYVSENKVDFVFTFNYSPVTSNNCKKHNLKYIAMVYDSPLVNLFSYTIINPCNYVFIFDQALYLRLRNEGINTVYYCPLAVNTARLDTYQCNDRIHSVFDADVSFIGSMYNEKHNLFDRLNNLSDYTKGYLDGIMQSQLTVQGYYFIEELLSGEILEDMKRSLNYEPNRDGVETPEYVYAHYFIARKLAAMERATLLKSVSHNFQTKIYTHNPTPELPQAINMGPVDYYDNMPYVFKCSKINLNITLRSITSGIPLRALDIMGAGGFLLSNYQSDFLEHFVPDEDFVYYESESDLISKCRYYLEHEDKRTAIAENGYRKIKEFHTYEYRLREILEACL